MLKNLTQTFKDNCNAREVILSEYVVLDNIQIPVKAELNDDCYHDGNFIGTFIFKELRFETSNEYDFRKKEFEYYKMVGGESVKIGTFITTEITDNDTEETIKVVAMDYGLKTQVEYTSNLDYESGNITLLDVWNENCELSGIESGITSFTNSDFIVDSDQFSGTGATRRDVFIAIAQSSCSFVKVMNDDNIYLLLNEYPKGKAEGTNIELTDSANVDLVSLKLDGKSTQETTSGKNLFNIYSNHQKGSTDTSQASGVQVKYNEDGSITLNGTATKNNDIILDNSFEIKYENGKDYYMLIEYLGGSRTLGENALFRVAYVSYDGTNHYMSINVPTSGNVVTKLKTYTNQQYFGEIRLYQKNSGNVYNNFRIRISVMNDSNQSYEPYTGGQPSPSPDYPSEIENVKGKNLFKPTLATKVLNGITCTANGDGTYTLNGTATADATFSIGTDSNLIVGKTYKFVGCPNGGSTTTYRIGWNYHGYEYGNGLVGKKTSEARYIQIIIFKGITASNLIFKPMFTENTSSTYNDYVPYGNIQIVETGKNLFNTIFVQGARSNINGKDTIYSKNYIRTQNEIEVEPNTTYNIKSVSSKVLSGGDIHYYDKDGNFIKREAIGINIAKTTPGNCYYINFQYYLNTGLTPSDVYNTQVEKGPTATDYKPYTEEVVNIDLKGNELCSLPNGTKDELIVKDGRAKIIKRISKRIFNGTESWTLQSINSHDIANFKINLDDYVGVPNILAICDTFSPQTSLIANTTSEGFYLNAAKDLFIRIKKSRCSTVADWRTWLSTHNTIVQYELKTPEEIDLGEVSMLTTYEGTSNITNSEDAEMEVEYNSNNIDIVEEYTDLEDKRDTHEINAVRLALSNVDGNDATRIKDGVDPENANWLEINDNPFAYTIEKREQLIDNIFNKIKGFGYSSFKTETSFKPYLTCGDLIKFKRKDGVLVNTILLRYKHNFDEITLEAPSIINASVDYELPETLETATKKALFKVDQANGEIELIAKATGELETKTTQLRLDVDTIEGQISDIADITTTSEGVGTLVMQNINESEPIYLKIYPKLGDIKYLYPAEDLYPSDTLFPKVKTLRFHCTSENYDAEYELSKDLLWLNNDVYDEFILDYDNSACYVIRRVGVNADGSKYALTNTTQEDLTYPTIRLINGDYEVSLVGQPNAYLYVRLMVQNIYTTQFATKVELNSTIKQTKDEIDLEVSKKVGNDEVISKINQTAETITIQANKVNISGMISAINNNTTTTINGDKITTGSINASKVSSDIITTSNFNAQKINADNITSGTLSADKINGGTITASDIKLKGVSLTPSTSSIGGLSVSSGTISNNRMGLDTANGILRVFNNNGGSMILSNAARLSATAGVGISSNSNGNISAPSKNLDLKACSGAVAYLGCMSDASGKNERSAISCENGTLKLRSTGAIYANGVAIGGSSSKATKENIKDLSQEKKDELYNLIKDIPLKEYDYKEQYGKKENYGFIIEDIENTKLNTLLHIVQNKNNKDMKNYSSEDLVRLELVIIQELMKKNEMLEKRIEKLERNDK